MPKKTFTPEQVVAKLRQIEASLSRSNHWRWLAWDSSATPPSVHCPADPSLCLSAAGPRRHIGEDWCRSLHYGHGAVGD